MNKNTNLLKTLAIVIAELPEKDRDNILNKLAEKNEMCRIDLDILMNDLADAGEIELDI
jgi:hypothetical protein